MKTAVFQVIEHGRAHLVCVQMPSLQSAGHLESWLKMNAGSSRQVTLLGRFDAVHAALTQEEAETLILSEEKRRADTASTLESILRRLLRP
jgi:hypothetical protein